MKRILFFIAIVAVIYCGTTLSSCKKKGDTIGSVTVLDSLGTPVPSASVTLWQDTAVNPVTNIMANIRVTKTTDGSGNAKFTFANEAFLNIEATRANDTSIAHGFIKLQQNQTVEATVRF